jgi:succinate dehydrogenase / fumarate reductase cytochrome b subunit
LLALCALTFCFFYHLCNGIRHLFWDAGYGFEIPRARATGIAVVAAAIALNLVFWLVVLTGRGS